MRAPGAACGSGASSHNACSRPPAQSQQAPRISPAFRLLHCPSWRCHASRPAGAARGQINSCRNQEISTHYISHFLVTFFGASFCFSFSSQGASSCADQPMVWAGPRRVLLGWVLMAECCLLPVRRIIPGDYRSPQSISREPAGERCQRFRFCSIFTAQNKRRGATI